MRLGFKRVEKIMLLALLVTTAVSVICAFFICGSKLLATGGLLLTIAGIMQLEVTDFFRDIFDEYNDETKYPGGPPSSIARRVIDNPDTPNANMIESILFYQRKTGVYFLIVGSALQIVAVWT